ncbi:hypothetical protein SUS17_3844 [Sphingomonas sp. S17]|nr:hypothetical protein SUS17_3844 [Sphingomonas sp. S17]
MSSALRPISRTWLGYGHLAVVLFFTLSGFLLYLTYHDRFRRGLSAGAFLTLRLTLAPPPAPGHAPAA